MALTEGSHSSAVGQVIEPGIRMTRIPALAGCPRHGHRHLIETEGTDLERHSAVLTMAALTKRRSPAHHRETDHAGEHPEEHDQVRPRRHLLGELLGAGAEEQEQLGGPRESLLSSRGETSPIFPSASERRCRM